MRTLNELFLQLSKRPNQYVMYKVGGQFATMRVEELSQKVRVLAGVLETMGIQRGDRSVYCWRGWPVLGHHRLLPRCV